MTAVRSRRAAVAAAVVLGALAAAPAARADETIYAGPPNQYFTTSVSIDQGERVSFTNGDTVDHDVVARDRGADGQPLFGSVFVSRGGTAPVSRVEHLTTGSYAFFCSIHPNMQGTINVSSAGRPVPRPGTSPPPGQPTPGGGSGTQRPPAVSLRALDRKLSRVRRARALRLSMTVDEAATVRLTARAGRTTLGTATVRATQAGRRNVTIRLSARGRRAVERANRLRTSVTAIARDAAGNSFSARLTYSLR